jgi:plasmid stability protein
MWNPIMTKNLTLAVDDDVLARLRVYAAQHRTTVNALFRKHADELLEGADRRKAARDWMVAKTRENIARDAERAAARERGEDLVEETWSWSREATYSGRRFGGSGDD